jgi:hypothetical protein
MKKNLFRILAAVFMLSLVSCSDDNGTESPVTVNLDQVDLYLTVSGTLAGTVTLEIRDKDGALPALSTLSVNANTLTSGWNNFDIPDTKIEPGTLHSIYFIRSEPHSAETDMISWRSCIRGTLPDPYAPGESKVDSTDFGFRTYIDGVLDQQSTLVDYGYAISNSSHWWQEFIPAAN